MSASGTKRTSLVAPHMSAFWGKADILKLTFREGAFDAVVNAAIYTKVCGGMILANTQKILSGYAQLFRMSDEVDKKLLFAVDFTNRYPNEKATLCSDAKQTVEKLEAQFK
jgi:hypothetical protein